MDATGPVRLTFLDYGTFRVLEDGRVIGIQGYLVSTGDGRHVLVDTGFPEQYVSDPDGSARREGLDAFGRLVSLREENLPAGQLARVGVRPEDVTHLVVTHGDIDHVGGMHRFPDATLVLGRAEREAGPPRYHGDLRPLEWPSNATVVLIDEDTELLPGVEVLCSPGHSPGHLSLLVRLPGSGAVLLTADAISRPQEVETGRYGGAWDEALAARSAARLLQVAARERALVVYGHDPAQWPRLLEPPGFLE